MDQYRRPGLLSNLSAQVGTFLEAPKKITRERRQLGSRPGQTAQRRMVVTETPKKSPTKRRPSSSQITGGKTPISGRSQGRRLHSVDNAGQKEEIAMTGVVRRKKNPAEEKREPLTMRHRQEGPSREGPIFREKRPEPDYEGMLGGRIFKARSNGGARAPPEGTASNGGLKGRNRSRKRVKEGVRSNTQGAKAGGKNNRIQKEKRRD